MTIDDRRITLAAQVPNTRVNVLGVGISSINMDSAIDTINGWCALGHSSYVSVCTVHSIMECRRSGRLRSVVNASGLVTPDGMPLVWLSRRKFDWVSRVYGPDLMLELFSRNSSHRHFLYGGRDGSTRELAERLAERFPQASIVGTFEPPMGTAEDLANAGACDAINAADPSIVWVGLGCPKQELWMSLVRDRLRAPVLIGVGAAFDFHSGRVRQAPTWVRSRGFEWLYRLFQDPRRLWRRYLLDNLRFVAALFLQSAGIRHFPMGD